MTIRIGTLTFDPATTVAEEHHEELGGRDGRAITISGIVLNAASVADIHSRIDAILAEVSDGPITVSLRSGRRFWVEREEFTRNVSERACVGAWTMKLCATEPFEESETEQSEAWAVTTSGDTLALTNNGGIPTPLVVSLTAIGELVSPAITCDDVTIAYDGTVADGATIIFDGVQQTVTVDAVDVTPYTTGAFPELPAGTGTLTYTDDPTSAHAATGSVSFRERWW